MAPRKKKKDDSPGMGHNSKNAAGAELRDGIERIERLMEERATVNDDIKDVMGELKGRGYDARAIRQIIKERAADREAMDELEGIVQTYRHALGMPAPGEDRIGRDDGDDEPDNPSESDSEDDENDMV